jgi:hypothetical protein
MKHIKAMRLSRFQLNMTYFHDDKNVSILLKSMPETNKMMQMYYTDFSSPILLSRKCKYPEYQLVILRIGLDYY